MAWKYPGRIPRATQVIDFQDLNDAFLPFVEEDGKLGEHNWSEDMAAQLSVVSDLDNDMCMRYANIYWDDSDECSAGLGTSTETAVVYNSQGWSSIADSTGDTMSYSFTSKGGLCYVLATMQYSIGDEGLSDTDIPYCRLGIRLDGAEEPILVNGDQDFYSESESMELGYSGYGMGVDIDGAFPIQPGYHTIEIVAQVRQLPIPEQTDDNVNVFFYSRELFILEIH